MKAGPTRMGGMHPIRRSAFDTEMAKARMLLAAGRLTAAFGHLERAHVIGQAHVIPHVTSHWWMFRVELRRRRPAALVGQLARIILGALSSAVGVIPAGNTGGTDISMFKRMPVAAALQDIIDGREPGEGAPPPKR